MQAHASKECEVFNCDKRHGNYCCYYCTEHCSKRCLNNPNHCGLAFESEDKFKTRIKTEAIKDFAERLKSTFPPRESEKCTLDDCYTLDQIDTIMQEMIVDI